jgi:outer membrane lipoprotein carrier protein
LEFRRIPALLPVAMSTLHRNLALVMLVLALPILSADAAIEGTRIEEVLREVDARQKTLKTLRADFRQTKEVGLLAEPEISTGQFTFEQPNRVLWKYIEPRPVQMMIADGVMTTYYPQLRKAERMEIRRFEDRIFRYLGAGTGAIRELAKYFDLRFTEDRHRNEFILELTPKTKTLGKRVRSITIWIDRQTYFTTGFEYVEGDGDLTRFEFSKIEMNPSLSSDPFRLDIPAGVRIETIRLDR